MDFLRQQASKMTLGSCGDASRSPSSSSTKPILSQSQDDASASTQHPAEPADSEHPSSSASQEQNTARAVITIAILDARLPVSLWTSLNDWEAPIPMMGLGKDAHCRLNYICELDGIADRPFHYKIQTGDGEWVLDESKPYDWDLDGNVNNVGYPESSTDEPVSDHSAEQNVSRLYSYNSDDTSDKDISPSVQKNIRTDMASALDEVGDANDASDIVAVPLFRHESFLGDVEPRNNVRGVSSLSPPMSTIEEEPPQVLDSRSPTPKPEDSSAYSQAREYQRALIEAMPSSVASGFTRASVLLPKVTPNQASKVPHAPLMLHEMTKVLTTPAHSHESVPLDQVDELSRNPLMRHETALGIAFAASEDVDELEQAPLMRHETTVERTGGEQDTEPDELEHAPLMRHETGLHYSDDQDEEDVDELDHAPLMRHETNVGSAEETLSGESDELDQAPLMRHESNVFGQTAINFGTPAEGGAFGWRRQTAFYRAADSESSPRNSSDSEHLMFPMDSSQRLNQYRASSVYSEDWVSDESGRSDWDSEAVNLRLYGRRGPHHGNADDEDISELERAPTMSYEEVNDSDDSDVGELDSAPVLPHEASLSGESASIGGSDGSSELCQTRRILNGQILSSSKTNSFNSERLREDFKDRIFGYTRQRREDRGTDFSGGPLLTHERSSLKSNRSSSENLSKRDYRTFSNIFRPQRSNLPHRMPRTDQEDLDLLDSSLEIFPMDRDGVFNRVLDIGSRLPEDEVRQTSHREVVSPAVLSQACSSVDFGPLRSLSSMSLQSIREDAVEGEEMARLPSPVFATRVPSLPRPSSPIPLPNADDMATPMAPNYKSDYFEGRDPVDQSGKNIGSDDSGVRRRALAKQGPAIQYPEDEGIDDEDPSKRHGKVFAALALPPKPPEANVALPPKAARVSFTDSGETGSIVDVARRHLTPYPESFNGEDPADGRTVSKILRYLGACFPRSGSIFILGFAVAGAAFWWKRWT